MAYYAIYYEAMHVDLLPGWRQMILSCAVNCGNEKATKILQRVFNEVIPSLLHISENQINRSNLKIDGIYGSHTREVALIARPDDDCELYNRLFVDRWMEHYFDICRFNPAQMTFIKGWYNRAIKYR